MVPRLTIRSEVGVTNVIEYAEALATNQWQTLTNLVVTNTPYVFVDVTAPATKRFYRVVIPGATNVPVETNAPAGMALIPAGSFTMGDSFKEGYDFELPTHNVQVSAFYMDKYEVTKVLWDEVMAWAVTHGYAFDNTGLGKATNHPVHTVNWYDAVKWCNARSEKEGRVPAYYTSAAQTTIYRTGQVDVLNEWVIWNVGYRLPTEAEWEKAARGGASEQRFPWGNTISHSQANYQSTSDSSYDISPTHGYHPSFNDGVYPFTSPVGSFAPNAYGLYDMSGNVWEWCWDWPGSYSNGSQTDPHGPSSGSGRVLRGGSWSDDAFHCRVAFRGGYVQTQTFFIGFRSVLPSGQ
jgi:formylglycine-generating enzyme required for sulfatase activity